jgi:hypothetical protein
MLESTRIKTEIPGPKSRALMERRHRAVSSGVGIATPMFAREAKGALLTDVDGNTFIDFGGGIGVMNPRGSPTAASTSRSTSSTSSWPRGSTLWSPGTPRRGRSSSTRGRRRSRTRSR